MATKTEIQWADTSENPVAGCDGCELSPTRAQVHQVINDDLARYLGRELTAVEIFSLRRFTDEGPQHVMINREEIAMALANAFFPDQPDKVFEVAAGLVHTIRAQFRCYAATLHRKNAGHKGYALPFEKPKMFPGRMAKTACLRPLDGTARLNKPWMDGLPRMVFVSDMGDALSKDIPFEFLKSEIVDVVNSPDGQRHFWLWLTKRPDRMAKFAAWLAKQGVAWPDRLVAMTTVTSSETVFRIKQILKVPAKYRGLSIEPLWDEITPDLQGINWIISGGESGAKDIALPFHVEWAQKLEKQARATGAAVFLKQLGKRPFANGQPLKLNDGHGGDWSEWPEHLRVREFPAAWRNLSGNPVQ